MQEANSFRSKVLALLGIVAVVMFAGSSAQSAPSSDNTVQPGAASSQTPDGVSSPVCPGPRCPNGSTHASSTPVQAIKVKIDPPSPEESHPDPVNSTGGPSVNPGH